MTAREIRHHFWMMATDGSESSLTQKRIFVVGIVLPAKTCEIFISGKIDTVHGLQNTDGGVKLGNFFARARVKKRTAAMAATR